MNPKPWYRSKTIWFNLVMTASPIVAYLAANPAFVQAHVTPAHFLTYSFIVGVGNIVLRILTTVGVSFGSDVQ